MRKKSDLSGVPGKKEVTKEIRVERRFYAQRGSIDMLRCLIRAHLESV